MPAFPALATGPLSMPPSGIREVINVALQMPNPIRLEVGEPDFATPGYIVDAVTAFIKTGMIRYVGTAGIPSLREKLCTKLRQVNGIVADPAQINIGVGGIGAIASAFTAILEPGDQVLVPDPAWPCYRMMAAVAKAEVVGYDCGPANNFLPDPESVEASITRRTKLLVINSPGNPTGAVLPRALIEKLVAIADKHGLFVLSDECYDEITFGEPAISPASFAGCDRILSVFSFSKTYAMTGWRVGYIVTSRAIADIINKIHESNISCVSIVSQKAAEAALDGPAAVREDMVRSYRRRRDLCVGLLERHGMLINRPGGAFYIMADISRSGLAAREFALGLLSAHEVAVAPGSAFGSKANRSVRISLASSERALEEGIGRMAEFVEHSGRRRRHA